MPFVNQNAPLSSCRKCSSLFFFLKRIVIPSQHNVAPLYWPLPLGVPCQRLRKIMVLSDHSLIFFFFKFVEEIFVLNES